MYRLCIFYTSLKLAAIAHLGSNRSIIMYWNVQGWPLPERGLPGVVWSWQFRAGSDTQLGLVRSWKWLVSGKLILINKTQIQQLAWWAVKLPSGPGTYCWAAHSSCGDVDTRCQIRIHNCLMRWNGSGNRVCGSHWLTCLVLTTILSPWCYNFPHSPQRRLRLGQFLHLAQNAASKR